MPQAGPGGGNGQPGRLGAQIANEIGKLVADFAGRGATRSRAFVHEDVVVCLLVGAVERLTERKVIKFLSGTSTLADASVELFVLEPRGPNRRDGER